MYPDVQLYIDGAWTRAASGRELVVINPATGEPAGKLAHAERADLDRALEAAEKGFHVWRKISAHATGRKSCARRPTCCARVPIRSRHI